MKCLLRIAFAFVFFLFLGLTKDGYAQKTFIELTGGFTSSTFRGDERAIFQNSSSHFFRKYSGNLGVHLLFRTGDNFRLKIGTNFNSRGSALEGYSYPLFGGTIEFITMNYLEVPFLAVFGPENISFYAGPQLSFLLNSASINSPNKTDFGIKYGLGLDIHSFIVRTSFYTGFSNIVSPSEPKIRNGYYEVSVGFKFPFNVKSPDAPVNTNQKKKKKGIFMEHRPIDW